MPYIIRNPNPGAPVPPAPSATPLQRVGSALRDVATDVGSGFIQPFVKGYNTWFGESKPVNITPSTPYLGWTPGSRDCELEVCGVQIPQGVVMTHCQVSSDMSYRATSLQEEVRRTPRLVVDRFTYKDGNVIRRRSQYKVKNVDPVVDAQEQAVQEIATGAAKRISDQRKKEKKAPLTVDEMEDEVVKDSVVKSQVEALGQSYADAKNGKLLAKLRKVHLADLQPRTLELRFTILDVIAAGSPAVRRATRFDVLESLWRQFCQNPALKDAGAITNSGDKILTAAAKATVESMNGRLVRLSSPGINPYKVDIWGVKRFVHQEVPDSDMIFVRIILTEFESFFSENVVSASPATDTTAPAVPVKAPPATPPKPSYSPTGQWATLTP